MAEVTNATYATNVGDVRKARARTDSNKTSPNTPTIAADESDAASARSPNGESTNGAAMNASSARKPPVDSSPSTRATSRSCAESVTAMACDAANAIGSRTAAATNAVAGHRSSSLVTLAIARAYTQQSVSANLSSPFQAIFPAAVSNQRLKGDPTWPASSTSSNARTTTTLCARGTWAKRSSCSAGWPRTETTAASSSSTCAIARASPRSCSTLI